MTSSESTAPSSAGPTKPLRKAGLAWKGRVPRDWCDPQNFKANDPLQGVDKHNNDDGLDAGVRIRGEGGG